MNQSKGTDIVLRRPVVFLHWMININIYALVCFETGSRVCDEAVAAAKLCR